MDNVQVFSAYLEYHPILSRGLGTIEEPCSIAALNLALGNGLVDSIPDCASPVVGRWVIVIQDAIPDCLRNSAAWRTALPGLAGTGRDSAKEKQRLGLIMEWMWKVLLELQPIADRQGVGAEWKTMTDLRTPAAAEAAVAAVAAKAAYWAEAEAEVEAVAAVAARAAEKAYWAEAVAAVAARAEAAARAVTAAVAAETAARAVTAVAVAAEADFWIKVDPCALLSNLIDV